MIQEGYTQLTGNTGYLLLRVPQDILDEIKISVDEVQNNFTKAIPANKNLVGQIDKEYDTKLNYKATQYIKYTVEQYNNYNPHYLDKINSVSKMPSPLNYDGDGWINFQEKYEYNPIHNHSGVFSYVIWYQIPFYKEDEIKYGAGKGKKPELNQNGEFEFIHYNGESMKSTPLNIDKSMEGYIAIFPSSLHHIVYPFYTSDDYRITISGNVYLRGQ
jgi:hypothetical protein